MIWVLMLTAWADDVSFVPDGSAAVVEGPAAWMTEARWRRYAASELKLEACLAEIETAERNVAEAQASALEAARVAEETLADSQEAIEVLETTAAEAMKTAAAQSLRAERLKRERNVLFVVASTLGAVVAVGAAVAF